MLPITVKSWTKPSYPLSSILCIDFWLIYFPHLSNLLPSSLVRHWPADQKCQTKSLFFLSKKVVRCSTFVSCLTGWLHQSMMFTGDYQCCQYKICHFIVSKSKLVLNRCLLFLAYVKTIDVSTSQNFKRIFPYFILYCDLVLCSR